MTPRTDAIAARTAAAPGQPRRQTQGTKAQGSGSRTALKKTVSKSKKSPKKKPPKKSPSSQARKANTALKDPTKEELTKAVNQFMKKAHGGKEPGTSEFYKEVFKNVLV